MNGYRYIITRAICRQADDSRTDGIGATQLPFPAVRLNIDLTAIDHSEVTSDMDSLLGLFLTYYCKALSRTLKFNFDVHWLFILNYSKARSGFNKYITRHIPKQTGHLFFEK